MALQIKIVIVNDCVVFQRFKIISKFARVIAVIAQTLFRDVGNIQNGNQKLKMGRISNFMH